MDKKSLKIGFVGVGFMGYGMALNLIKQKLDLTIIAHKNRVPINKLIQKGADVKDMVPQSVYEYILKKRLYHSLA